MATTRGCRRWNPETVRAADSEAASNVTDAGNTAADAAADALEAAREAEKAPTNVALANKAAEAEEKAVKTSKAAWGKPELVKIPRLTAAQS